VIPAPAVFPPLPVVSKVTVFERETIPDRLTDPPLVIIFPPLVMAVALAFVVVAEKFPSAVVLPIFSGSKIVPVPAAMERACAPAVVPLIVPPNEMLALLVVMILLPVRLIGTALGKLRGFAPETVMFDPICRRAPVVKERFVRAVIPPMLPERVMFPVPARRVRDAAPSIVLVKSMLAPVDAPAFVVSIVGVFVRATGPVRVIAPLLVVVMFPSTLIKVEPV